ncbi:MAG: thioesterase [Verrucomicrobiales bacterium]|nr:thioesterase [Verrucomicrobiales bacterium]|tara:strand:- start:1162 stop:1632 length:471 start_codon:yes stop_codon:yes gene_type:complete
MPELPHTHSCFVCGEKNVHGLQLRFETDGEAVRTCFIPQAAHSGFLNVTHGGILATVLDEIMVWACAVGTKRFAYCAEMTVRFRKPATPGNECSVIARLDEDRRGKIYKASGEILDGDHNILASATGKYRPIEVSAVAGMLSDVVGDVSWIEGAGG